MEHTKDLKLAICLVDVTLADQRYRILTWGPKCNVQRKIKQFPADVSLKEACRAVVLSFQGKRLKVGKETGKGWGQERGRMRM
jgi:hypothetical protein